MAGIGKRITLEQWIDEALIDGDKDGAISAMTLMHLLGSKSQEVHGVRFGTQRKWTGKELAQLFQSKADGCAQDLPGAQYFELLAFYAERQEPQARHKFQVIGEPDIPNLISEKPDAQGVMTQSMKHLEFQHRELYMMTRHLVDALVETNKTQADRLREQEKELHESMLAMRQLALGRLTEEHEFRMKEKKVERDNAMMSKLMEYAPLILDGITGGKLLPQAKKDSMLIDQICRTVPPEKLMDLVSAVPPELAAALIARLEQAQLQNSAAEESAETALALRKDPADDAAGD